MRLDSISQISYPIILQSTDQVTGGQFHTHKYGSHPRVQSDRAPADDGHVDLARLDGLARLDEGDEGGAAGGVDVHGGAVEVVEEGEPVGVHALRAPRVLVTRDRLAVLQPGCHFRKIEKGERNFMAVGSDANLPLWQSEKQDPT